MSSFTGIIILQTNKQTSKQTNRNTNKQQIISRLWTRYKFSLLNYFLACRQLLVHVAMTTDYRSYCDVIRPQRHHKLRYSNDSSSFVSYYYTTVIYCISLVADNGLYDLRSLCLAVLDTFAVWRWVDAQSYVFVRAW